ncbi:MAG TPA: GNAT family N-acetyltransferase [Aggregatilineaceae bacterium]|nr:GNAT family N-acetyltransferase [Aggregatilineaceae bacterium]
MNVSSSIHEQRRLIRRILDDSSPGDAPTAYYALFYDPQRSALFCRTDASHRMLGFAGVFQTGIDLFRPLISLRCQTPECAADLLAEALQPGRPYILFCNLNQLPLVGGSLRTENLRILQIHQLDSARFRPVMNVLVQTKMQPVPRCEINSNGLKAVAGINWQSPAFAEIWVHTDAEARERGWGISVASAVTELILRGGRIPLYLVEHDNDASLALASRLGYVDTGDRQVYADVVYEGHPSRG